MANRRRYLFFLAGLLLLVTLAGCGKTAPSQAADVAVTNSYLAAMVRDLLGSGTAVLSLAGPGNCPGHFDITPNQVANLRRCQLLLRFDFQKHFDRKLSQAVDGGLKIVEVSFPGGLCEPASYLAGCGRIAEALVAAGKMDRLAADVRLSAITLRMAALTTRLRAEIKSAGLAGREALVACHQKEFCRWLGLRVLGTFSSHDNPAMLAEAIKQGRDAGAKLIVGNIPAGQAVPQRLANELDASLVMFANFPTSQARPNAFDQMLLDNVGKLTRQ